MSRGGRGSGRGGRGGRLKGGRPEWEIGQVLDSKPSDLFPPYKVPIPAPPTEKEKRIVAEYLSLRDQFHESSMYTKPTTQGKKRKTYGEEQANNQYHKSSKADVDPFLGVPRYSEKYEAKARTIPKLVGPFNKELFPKELWSTLEGEEGAAVKASINKAMKKKALLFSGNTPTKALSKEEKMKYALEHVEDSDGEQQEEEEEESDHVYDDEDDEMAGDYNAEQYFEDGADDDADDGDGGGEYS